MQDSDVHEARPIVTVEWLAGHLEDPEVVVLEVSSTELAESRYARAGHIPGASFAWWKDLCWHESDREFPTPEVMAARLRALGVSEGSRLVLVGDPIQFATYAFWVLTLTGLEHGAVVLDGGRRLWEQRGLPLVEDPVPTVAPGDIQPRAASDTSRVGRDDVLAHLQDPARVLLDMRTDEEYSGERVSPRSMMATDHGAERKGRIPGARHLYFERLLADDGAFLPSSAISAQFASVGVSAGDDVVAYCRLSHRATLGWFAATRLAGWPGVRVYDGSWTEWGSIVGFPIER